MEKAILQKVNSTRKTLLLPFFYLFLLQAMSSYTFPQGGDASKSPSSSRSTVKSGTESKKNRRAPQPSGGTPSPAERHFERGRSLVGNNDSEAETELKEAVRLVPNNAQYHLSLGGALNNQGKFTEAEREYGEAVRLAPTTDYMRISHAVSLEELKKYPEAEAEFREAIRINPKYVPGRFGLARDLDLQNRLVEAEIAWREVVLLNPDAGDSLANNLLLQRKYSEAETQYRGLLRNASEHPSQNGGSYHSQAYYHYGLGMALYGQGKRSEGVAEFREAARLEPNNKTYQDNLNRVQ